MAYQLLNRNPNSGMETSAAVATLLMTKLKDTFGHMYDSMKNLVKPGKLRMCVHSTGIERMLCVPRDTSSILANAKYVFICYLFVQCNSQSAVMFSQTVLRAFISGLKILACSA